MFYKDRPFPLTTLGFHGFIPYKVSANGTRKSLLNSIAFGGSCAVEFEDNIDMTMIGREIYLSSLPMTKLAYSKTVDAQITDELWEIYYEDGQVNVNFKTDDYEIIYKGKIISKNYKTFLQVGENEFCYYSIESKKESLDLPEAWNEVNVYELSENGKTYKSKITRTEGFNFDFKADKPYLITNEAK